MAFTQAYAASWEAPFAAAPIVIILLMALATFCGSARGMGLECRPEAQAISLMRGNAAAHRSSAATAMKLAALPDTGDACVVGLMGLAFATWANSIRAFRAALVSDSFTVDIRHAGTLGPIGAPTALCAPLGGPLGASGELPGASGDPRV